MPLVLADRVKETTTTTGTGTITLDGASTGFQSFSVIGNGNTTYYTIAGQGTSEWEVGIGTYTSSGTTLSRDTVLASSAGAPTKTTFSAGTKDVFVTYPAERSVYSDGTNIVPDNAAVLLPVSGGTGQSSLTANNVLLGNGTSAVQFVAPGTNGNVLTSNGTTWTSAAVGGGFAAGTAMMFVQTAAPTGWTKSTTHNNKALRVVSGTASSGGSVAFTTAFASQTPAGSVSTSVSVSAGTLAVSAGTLATSSTTLTTSQIPAHAHRITPAGTLSSQNNFYNTFNGTGFEVSLFSNSGTAKQGVDNTGGGGSHTHTLNGSPSLSGSPSVTSASSTFTGTAINLAVQYVDVIIATKD
jgi:hypothetical protein